MSDGEYDTDNDDGDEDDVDGGPPHHDDDEEPTTIEEVLLTPGEMLYRGLKLYGVPKEVQARRRKGKKNLEIFMAVYGAHPNHCAKIWEDIFRTDVPTAKVSPKEADLVGFFLALNHARMYLTDEQRNPIFGSMDFKEMRSTTFWWVCRIAALKEQVIVWPSDEEWGDTTIIVSVDGTHMRCNEVRHPTLKRDPTWYSFKHKTAGHNLQITLDIRRPRCVDLFVGRAGQNDMGNWNNSGVEDKIPEGKRAIVDGGYEVTNEERLKVLSGYNQWDDEKTMNFKKRVKSRHETYNAKLKVYDVMTKVFRHHVNRFPIYVDMVCVLVQYAITDTDPESVDILFDV